MGEICSECLKHEETLVETYLNECPMCELEEENRRLREEISRKDSLSSVLLSTIGELNLASNGCYFHIIDDMNKSMANRIKCMIDKEKEQGDE